MDAQKIVKLRLRSPHYGLEQPKIQTALLSHSLVRSLVPLHRSLVCLLRTARSRPPLRSLVRSLAHFAHSLARGKVNFSCLKMTWFCPIVRRFQDGALSFLSFSLFLFFSSFFFFFLFFSFFCDAPSNFVVDGSKDADQQHKS